SYHGDFNDEIFVMRKSKLKLLKDNVRSFFKEFKNYDLQSLDETIIHKFIKPHNLDIESLTSIYTESIIKAKK
ncbi:hypothetical protein F9J48_20140, partial [Salmonella enterica subsp. enterica serovar Heidelberg]|nr:hypothetical protein [Salmonella enterica subsp. enterica serovar Heidelberg]